MGLTGLRRRSIGGNISSVSSEVSSCSGDSSPVRENALSEVETHVTDMAEIAKRRRQGRSKSVPHVRRFNSSGDETFEFSFNTKLDASSFHELPTTTLCSTELWIWGRRLKHSSYFRKTFTSFGPIDTVMYTRRTNSFPLTQCLEWTGFLRIYYYNIYNRVVQIKSQDFYDPNRWN